MASQSPPSDLRFTAYNTLIHAYSSCDRLWAIYTFCILLQ